MNPSFMAGAAVGAMGASFAHPEAVGRRFLYYARAAHCYRRANQGGILAIGDSITIGRSRPDWGLLGNDSWFSHAITIGRLPYCWNAGLADQPTEWIAARLPWELEHRRPDVVAVLAGTNDVLHGMPLDRPLRLIESMISQVREANATPVIATLPPIAGAETLNERLRRLNVAIIDFHAALSDREFSDDGLHPNAVGARVMGEAAAPVLREALTKRE